MIQDHAEHRVSACPVHFIWDGLGKGRMLVRWGFFGLVFALAVFTGTKWMHLDVARPVALGLLGVSLALYVVGQALSSVVRFTRARPG